MDLYRDVDPDDQARCTQVAQLLLAYFSSYFPLHFFHNFLCMLYNYSRYFDDTL